MLGVVVCVGGGGRAERWSWLLYGAKVLGNLVGDGSRAPVYQALKPQACRSFGPVCRPETAKLWVRHCKLRMGKRSQACVSDFALTSSDPLDPGKG